MALFACNSQMQVATDQTRSGATAAATPASPGAVTVQVPAATQRFTWQAPADSAYPGLMLTFPQGSFSTDMVQLSLTYTKDSDCAQRLSLSADQPLAQPVSLQVPSALLKAATASGPVILTTITAGKPTQASTVSSDADATLSLATWGDLVWGSASCAELKQVLAQLPTPTPTAAPGAAAATPTPLPPRPPVLAAPGPGAYRLTAAVAVSGQADAGSSVVLFLSGDCSGSAALTASAADFANGVTVTASPDTATVSVSAQARGPGGASACTPAPGKSTAIAWQWENGQLTAPFSTVAGTQGVAAAANVPTTRAGFGAWMTGDGVYYVFGGNVNDWGDGQDLWSYDTKAGQWTWVNGSTTPATSANNGTAAALGVEADANAPGSRAATATWVGKNGLLYLYSGFSHFSTCAADPWGWAQRADLWSYNRTTKRWALVAGSVTDCQVTPTYGSLGAFAAGNTPGSRQQPATWVDAAGDLWLFGGASNGVMMADLWKFDVAAAQWAWMGGPQTANGAGVYGTLNAAASGNLPGARGDACVVPDGNGHVYLYGGDGFSAAGNRGLLSDLWSFDLASLQWTWLGGSKVESLDPSFGSVNVAAAGNLPGGRRVASCWVDSKQRFWLFGGAVRNSVANANQSTNDVWQFDPGTGQWAWVAGPSSYADPGSSGTLGARSFQAEPAARNATTALSDGKGRAWIYGGASASTAPEGNLSDVWSLPVP